METSLFIRYMTYSIRYQVLKWNPMFIENSIRAHKVQTSIQSKKNKIFDSRMVNPKIHHLEGRLRIHIEKKFIRLSNSDQGILFCYNEIICISFIPKLPCI